MFLHSSVFWNGWAALVWCEHRPVHTERAELSPSSWLDERPDLHNSRRVTLRPVLSHGVRQPSFTNSLIYLKVLVKGARGISVQFSRGLYSNFMVSSTFCRVQHYEPSEKWCCNLETKMCRVISYHIKNRTAQCIAMLLTYLSMEVRASISWLFGRSVFVFVKKGHFWPTLHKLSLQSFIMPSFISCIMQLY